MGGDRKDFFVSHAGADRAWAEWVAWQLTDAGYTVELDAWDWPVGQNFMLAISDALARCDRVLALFSPAYFERPRYTTEEWTAALVHEPSTGQGRLVPVRVEIMPAEDLPAVLRPLIFCNLVGLDAVEARRVLLETVQGPKRPDGEPVFPGGSTPGGLRKLEGAGPRLPGSVPRVWNLPAVTRGSPGGRGCWWRCGSGCWPGKRQWCRRSRVWAGWARPSWRSSMHTGSPEPMSWPGGSTPSRQG